MDRHKIHRCCVFIVGPTAAGKTRLSLDIAKMLKAEIISADSRQIYKYLDIGTATPTTDELSWVCHHFINEKKPDELFSAGEFGIAARKIIHEKMSSGQNVLICGGSGLYIQAVLGMINETPASRRFARDRVRQDLERRGLPALVNDLNKIDPSFMSSLDINNPRRICRALEIYHSTGKKPSDVVLKSEYAFPYDHVLIGLRPERQFLYRRINQRVLDMVDAGLVDELKGILSRGYSPNLNALNTVGYKEIMDYLDDKISLETAIADIQKHTRHFAKRQMTWFRKYEPHVWIDFDAMTAYEEILSRAKSAIINACPGQKEKNDF